MNKASPVEGYRLFKLIVVSVMIIAVVILFFLFGNAFTVKEVTVTGNRHYTVEQIQNIIMQGRLGKNSIYLYFKYSRKAIEDVPFIERMDVKILSPSSISITVYEKSIAGCVEYLDRYIYFDREGIVVESSSLRQNDLPYVTGLNFDYVIMYEPLPVENPEIFKSILNITQLLSKYEIRSDQIYFDSDNNITLFFGKAKVKLGSFDNIDEKMIRLQGIAPKMEGLDGTLYMDDYTENSDNDYITFQRDDVEKHEEITDGNDLTQEENSQSENAEAQTEEVGEKADNIVEEDKNKEKVTE